MLNFVPPKPPEFELIIIIIIIIQAVEKVFAMDLASASGWPPISAIVGLLNIRPLVDIGLLP